MQPLLNEPWKDETWYRNQWRAYYRMRQRLVAKLAKLVGIGSLGILGANVLFSERWRDVHPVFSNVAMIAVAFYWLYVVYFWFKLNFSMSAWDCPRCNQRFFRGRATLSRRCQECGLKRPLQSSLGSLHSSD